LSRPPFNAERQLWIDPDDYTHTQALGIRIAQAGITALRYWSARAPEPGHCVAVLDLQAFADRRPRVRQTWHLYLGDKEATATRAMAGDGERHAFSRSGWAL